MENKKVVILGQEKSSTAVIYHALKEDFEIDKVIIEKRQSRNLLIQRRLKRLGFLAIIGQVLFRILIVPSVRLLSRKRYGQLKKDFGLNEECIPISKIMRVETVNSNETIELLRKISPGIVVVNGARKIEENVFCCIPGKFINFHTGITPAYRGVFGAYWALVRGDREGCGVTIHFVDSGLDTGGILEQGIIQPTAKDSIGTYPLLQFISGIPLLKKAIAEVLNGRTSTKVSLSNRESRLWTHPTIWGYFWYLVIRKVK